MGLFVCGRFLVYIGSLLWVVGLVVLLGFVCGCVVLCFVCGDVLLLCGLGFW